MSGTGWAYATALLMAAAVCVPAVAQNLPPTQSPPTPAEPQTHIMLTLATAVTVAAVIFVTAFLLDLWCGWIWRRR